MTPRQQRPRRGRGTVAKVVASLIVTLLIAVVVGTLTVTDDDLTDDTTTTVAPTLSGAAAELAALLETRQTVAYHARYEGSSDDASTIVIETWQDGEGQVRQDQILSTGEQAAHLVSIDGGAVGPIRCNRVSEAEWTCRRAAPAEADGNDPIAAIRERLAEGEVTAENTQIDGDPARCFDLLAEGQQSELCVRPDSGVPVRIGAANTELRLVIFEDEVDPAVFEPPGPVT